MATDDSGNAPPRVVPLSMPSPSAPGLQRQLRWMGRALGQGWRQGRALLRSFSTPEGRRRDLAPLIVVTAAGGFVLGLVLGVRHRHGRM